jgi:hypothetical protein
MSVCRSAYNNSPPTGRIFMKFLIWSIFRKSVEKKIQVSLKSDKNRKYFTWRLIHIFDHIAQFYLEWKILQEIVEKLETHILCSNPFFFEHRAVYEIMWKNRLQLDRSRMTVWRMPITCRILEATDTHSEYVKLTAFPLQQWLHECASLLRYTYIVCFL